MPPALFKLVAMLLLVMQGAIAVAPGRVLCIPVKDCGTYEQDAVATCSHRDREVCPASVGGGSRHNHEREPFNIALHPNDECGCHVHVPVPGNEQVPSNFRSDTHDLRVFFVPLTVALVLNWDCDPPPARVAHSRPPDFSASGQVLALKATRLLI
ncbi:MAG: hypothetical protein KF787_08960 [Phycisphaeraceae bacterium]|nr:hypothetical protein [Phycisphaeraceae bacterium]